MKYRTIPADRDYRLAVIHLLRSMPLPLDLGARLLEKGYDVSAIEARFAR